MTQWTGTQRKAGRREGSQWRMVTRVESAPLGTEPASEFDSPSNFHSTSIPRVKPSVCRKFIAGRVGSAPHNRLPANGDSASPGGHVGESSALTRPERLHASIVRKDFWPVFNSRGQSINGLRRRCNDDAVLDFPVVHGGHRRADITVGRSNRLGWAMSPSTFPASLNAVDDVLAREHSAWRRGG